MDKKSKLSDQLYNKSYLSVSFLLYIEFHSI